MVSRYSVKQHNVRETGNSEYVWHPVRAHRSVCDSLSECGLTLSALSYEVSVGRRESCCRVLQGQVLSPFLQNRCLNAVCNSYGSSDDSGRRVRRGAQQHKAGQATRCSSDDDVVWKLPLLSSPLLSSSPNPLCVSRGHSPNEQLPQLLKETLAHQKSNYREMAEGGPPVSLWQRQLSFRAQNQNRLLLGARFFPQTWSFFASVQREGEGVPTQSELAGAAK